MLTTRMRLSAALIVVSVLAACDREPTSPDRLVSSIDPVEAALTAWVGQTVQLQVLAQDAARQPVAGARVTFQVEEGPSTLDAESVITGADGIAAVGLRVDDAGAGQQVVRVLARVNGAHEARIEVTPLPAVEVDWGMDEAVVALPGASQTLHARVRDLAGEWVSDTLAFRLLDSGIVTLHPLSGGSPSWAAQGVEVRSVQPGTARIVAAHPSGVADTLQVEVASVLLERAGETRWMGLTGETFGASVRALDSSGQPVSGLQVAFSDPSHGSTVSPATAVTDADGYARTDVTLGNEGLPREGGWVIFEARAPGAKPLPLGISTDHSYLLFLNRHNRTDPSVSLTLTPGDTAGIFANLVDHMPRPVYDPTGITLTSSDPSVVALDPPVSTTVDVRTVARARTAGSVLVIGRHASGVADTVRIEVKVP